MSENGGQTRDERETKLLGYMLGKWQVHVELMKLDVEARNLMESMEDDSVRHVAETFLEKVKGALGDAGDDAMETLLGFLSSMGIDTEREN